MKAVLNAIRFVVAALIGSGVAYFWMTIREEQDMMLLAGIGIVSFLISYLLLHMWSKG